MPLRTQCISGFGRRDHLATGIDMRHGLGILVATLIGMGCEVPSENLPTLLAVERAEEAFRLAREDARVLGRGGVWATSPESESAARSSLSQSLLD